MTIGGTPQVPSLNRLHLKLISDEYGTEQSINKYRDMLYFIL